MCGMLSKFTKTYSKQNKRKHISNKKQKTKKTKTKKINKTRGGKGDAPALDPPISTTYFRQMEAQPEGTLSLRKETHLTNSCDTE